MLTGTMAEAQWKLHDEQLRAIQSEIQSSKPVSTRLRQLRRTETHHVKMRQQAADKVVSMRQAAQAALQSLDEAKAGLADADVELVSIRDQVTQATLEKQITMPRSRGSRHPTS